MTIEQLQLVKRATKLAYPDSMEMEDGSLIKNPAAYEKLCKESIVTNCRKSHMEITKEELFDELTSMSKDELVKDFIYILDHQSALTSSNRELRSSSDSLRRRTKAYPDSLEMEDRSLINYPTAYAELMTKEEFLEEHTNMSNDKLVKDFIKTIDHQRALAYSNRELCSSNDNLRRRTNQKTN